MNKSKRRLYRTAIHFPESGLLNGCIAEELVIDPQASSGIHDDRSYRLLGREKREQSLGLGLPGWGGGNLDPRYVVSEWAAALEKIDPVLVPTADDLLVGWLNPTNFCYYNGDTGIAQSNLAHGDALREVGAFPGLKVLLVGDTHHNLHSLSNAIDYMMSEPWDAVLLCHQSAHIDWFRAALGEDRVFPYLLQTSPELLGMDQRRLLPTFERERQELTFYGKISGFHPKRSATLKQLKLAMNCQDFRQVERMPMRLWTEALQGDAAVVCGCINNQISINQIYSLLAGALVFSDRFYQGNGWGKHLLDNKHLLFYSSVEELLDLYQHYRKHPEAGAKIARQGREHAEELFGLRESSHGWLQADSSVELRQGLRTATAVIEQDPGQSIRWSSQRQFREDLGLYGILHELTVFFWKVLWISGPDASGELVRAVQQQLPAVLAGNQLPSGLALDGVPVVMTRLPEQRELLALERGGGPYVLVLLGPDSGVANHRQAFDALLPQAPSIGETTSFQSLWLGEKVWRNNLGIQVVSHYTTQAAWTLPPGWNAGLLCRQAGVDRLVSMF